MQPAPSSTPAGVSVVIPVHNEAPTLPTVVAELRSVLGEHYGRTWEIIIVDDSSTDRRAGIGLARDGCVRVISLPRRHGSGHARRMGSQHARGTYIAWMDGDGTYDPHDLPALVAGLRDCDQVIGARREEAGSWRLLRTLVKRLTCAAVSLIWQRRIPDLNSGLRVFRRESLMRYLHELPNGFSCVTTATLAALNRGQVVGFRSIGYRARPQGSQSKFHPLWDTIRLWQAIHRQWQSRALRRS